MFGSEVSGFKDIIKEEDEQDPGMVSKFNGHIDVVLDLCTLRDGGGG